MCEVEFCQEQEPRVVPGATTELPNNRVAEKQFPVHAGIQSFLFVIPAPEPESIIISSYQRKSFYSDPFIQVGYVMA